MEATFGFVDLSGFTALTEAHGDEAAANVAERFVEMARDCLRDPGRLVKTIGDAVLVEHAHPAEALQFIEALAVQAGAATDMLALRGGLHHGEAVRRGADVFGNAVNLAARVAAQASAGQLLLTSFVADAARSRGMKVIDLGEQLLRSIVEPVSLYLVDLGGGDRVVTTDPVCQMKVDARDAPGRLRLEGVEYAFCSIECAGRFASNPAPYLRRRS